MSTIAFESFAPLAPDIASMVLVDTDVLIWHLRGFRTASERLTGKTHRKDGSRRPPKTFLQSIVALVGHLAGTALVFMALFTLGWLVSCFLNYLHQVHPFPPGIFDLVTRLEVGLVYVDVLVSGIALLAGIGRFLKDAVRGH